MKRRKGREFADNKTIPGHRDARERIPGLVG
jgi:hypothetical protein